MLCPKVGSDNTGREEIMGKHGLGTMNENGELFADFCTFNDLVIGGNAQSHMGLTRWENRESDRPHNHKQELEKKSSGHMSKERS